MFQLDAPSHSMQRYPGALIACQYQSRVENWSMIISKLSLRRPSPWVINNNLGGGFGAAPVYACVSTS